MKEQKIIDIHAHVFPEPIRKKAVEAIGRFYDIPMYGEGSPEDLLFRGSPFHVVKYVVNSAATTADQVQAINRYIKSVQDSDTRFIGFGTIHQNTLHPHHVIDDIIEMGLHGVKLHPDFQKFDIDDPKLFPIYEAMAGRLPLLIHMGDERTDASSPARLLNVIKMFPTLTIIAPHLGGYSRWDEAFETIIGQDIYIDTSSALAFMPPEKAAAIIRAHGIDKVLFGSDYPMWLHKDELERFYALGFTGDENEKILFGNAARLLGVSDDK